MDYYKTPEEFMSACGYTIDGVWYPRVTKIVSIKAKPALYRFYASVGYVNGQNIAEKSAEEGTKLHEAVEGILLGKEADIDPGILPAVESFRGFLKDNGIEVVPDHVERRILHKTHKYSGTTDALACIGGKFGVLDIKTSLSIYRDYNLQTAAYIEALKDDFPALETRWILRIDQAEKCTRCNATRRIKGYEKIRANGRYPCPDGAHDWGERRGIIEIKEFPDWKSDFEAFLGAKRLWEWENEEMLESVGYLPA